MKIGYNNFSEHFCGFPRAGRPEWLMHVMPWWTYQTEGENKREREREREREKGSSRKRELWSCFSEATHRLAFLSASKKSIKTRLQGAPLFQPWPLSSSSLALKPTLASWGYKDKSGIPQSITSALEIWKMRHTWVWCLRLLLGDVSFQRESHTSVFHHRLVIFN